MNLACFCALPFEFFTTYRPADVLAGWLAGWLGDCLCRSLGVWLARHSETCETWFTLAASWSPQSPWQLVVPVPGGGGGGLSRGPTLHFSGWARGHQHIWLAGRLTRHVSLLSFRGHADTHPLTRLQPTCCCAARGGVQSSSRDTGALLHKQTNKQTHLLLLTISRRREGEQNKQFHLHDSSLLYISTLWQWWSEALLEAAGNEERSSCLLFRVSTGRGSLHTWNSSHAVCSASRRRGFCVWCPSPTLCYCRADNKRIFHCLLLSVSPKWLKNKPSIWIFFMQKRAGGLEPVC